MAFIRLLLYHFYFFFQFPYTPKSIGLIQPFLFFTSLTFSRYVARAYLQKKSKNSLENSLIIIGDVDSIYKLLENFGGNFSTHYLISTNDNQWGRSILGKKIQPISKLDEIIKYRPKGLLIIDQQALGNIKKYWEELLKCDLRFSQFKKNEDPLILHPVEYHSIIFSEPAFNINIQFYQNKCVLISGAGGSIGSFIAKELTKASNINLILLDNNELNLFNIQKQLNSKDKLNISYKLINILDKQKVTDLFAKNKIDIVIHAAAYKHVGLLEDQPQIALENNYQSTKVLYDNSKKYRVSNFLLVSTDKAVRPTSLMGVSKRLAELYCLVNKSDSTKLSIVRFGNVINSSGSVLPIFIDQILKNLPITVTHKEVRRYFMSIEQASKLVLEANTFSEHAVFHLDMGKPQNIYQLAINLIKLYGYQPVNINTGNNEQHSRLVKITGLNKGEKLFEELLIDKKNQPTRHKKIFASIENINFNQTLKLIDKTENYLSSPDTSLLKEILSDQMIKYKTKI